MKRKKVRGVGVSDLPVCEDGAHLKWYITWRSMLKRCYCPKDQAKFPTYIGCRVCDEWLTASKFKKWFDEHYIEGYCLDKDYLGDGKLYSPETCCFVPQWLNLLLNDHGRARGKWPQGVHLKQDKYVAQIRVDGTRTHLGYFSTPEDAFEAYEKAKRHYVHSKLTEMPERIREGVIRKLENQLK